MTKWQPIETAPRDGTEVVVYCPGQRHPVFTASYIYGWSCSVEGRYSPMDDFFGDEDKKPTHWMPLPEPPQ